MQQSLLFTCLLVCWAAGPGPGRASLECSSCGIPAPSLGPRCPWAVWQRMLCKARPHPVPKTASQSIEQGCEFLPHFQWLCFPIWIPTLEVPQGCIYWSIAHLLLLHKAAEKQGCRLCFGTAWNSGTLFGYWMFGYIYEVKCIKFNVGLVENANYLHMGERENSLQLLQP